MPERRKTRVQHLHAAAEAHTNLTVFHAVISLMEGGHLYGNTPQQSAARIIAICKSEAHRQLRTFDKHSALALQGASDER